MNIFSVFALCGCALQFIDAFQVLGELTPPMSKLLISGPDHTLTLHSETSNTKNTTAEHVYFGQCLTMSHILMYC